MSVPRSIHRRRLGTLAGVTSVLLLATMLAAGPAPAQVACDTSTIDVVPQGNLTPGTLGDGVTTLAANTAAPFTFEVVGTIPDGWMLGLDAIVIHITGPQGFLDETGGVFFGMSGSPAYVGGDLAGAVSGVFYDDATFGVLTPAEAMLDVMDAAQPPVTPKQTIVPTDDIRRAIARIQGRSVSSVTGTFQQLPTPLAVSGLSRKQAAELQTRLDERGENFWVYRAASASSTAALDPTQFFAGETLGAAISYGDASYYATGTATFVCGDYVAAFGHPFFYDAPGEISLGLSGAEGLMVLKPTGWPGYRFALLTEPRGTIVQDRFAGIVGAVGVTPPSVPITSDLDNLDEGTSRLGTTEAVHTWGWWLEELVWAHLWANFAATFGHYGGGTSQLAWTLTGHTAAGPFSVSDFSMASSPWDVTDSMWPLISSIDALQFNEFEEVTFDDISMTGWVTKDRLEGTIGQVLLSSTSFPTPTDNNVIRARPGDTVTIQVSFDMLEGDDEVVTAYLVVPKNPRRSIEIKMRGGRDRTRYWDAGSFDELLELLVAKEHVNDLVISGIRPTQRLPQDFVVSGRDRFYVRTRW
jgi:hypothetical protein